MIGAAKKRCEPSLFQRRAAANPTLNPLPKLFVDQRPTTRLEDEGIGPDATFRKEIISDGIEQGVQVRHSSRGKQWNPQSDDQGATTRIRYYYTQGPVPGLIRAGTARLGPYDQVIVDLCMNFDNVVAALLSVSPSLRQAVRNPAVKRVSTNFFPMTVSEGEGKQFCTSIYMPQSMSDYPGRLTDFVLYPATLSYDKNAIKCRVAAVPFTSDKVLLRPFQTTDDQEEVSVSHITQLLEVFKDKWQTKTLADCEANGIGRDEIDGHNQ